MTTLKYVEQPQMGSTEEPKLVTTTVHAYDVAQMKQLYKAQLMGVGMSTLFLLHLLQCAPKAGALRTCFGSHCFMKDAGGNSGS